jgi:hypothetical protein
MSEILPAKFGTASENFVRQYLGMKTYMLSRDFCLPQIHEMARQQQIGYLIGKYVQNMTSNNP